jgi:hypothetical protein
MAAINVTKTECVVRYTLPTPTRAPLTTASKAAVFGPPFGDRGLLGGAAGTGVELSTITSLGPRRVGDTPLLLWPAQRPDCEA